MKKLFSLMIMVVAFMTMAVGFIAQAYEYKQVQAYHILVPTEAKALEIKKEIGEGINRMQTFNNFREAAKKYSQCPSGRDGGMLGWFSVGDMVKPFEEAAFTQLNGTVSEPVKTQFGWHLIYVSAKK